MYKIRNTGLTDIATAIQNVKDFRSSSLWTCSHLMALLLYIYF